MKSIKKFSYILAGMMLMFAPSCVQPEKWHDKYDNSIVPGPVSNIQVENINGGSIIFYTLPSVSDDNMLGAKVSYSLTPDGEVMERFASTESDSIILEGFGDTDKRTVTVYAIHKNGNISTGVEATIEPLTPPIFLIRETMKAQIAFGGLKITWDNPLRKDMGIALWVEDTLNREMVLFDKYFSKSVEGKTYFRPFKPEARNFRIDMFDRWQNYAQPLDTTLTPLEETEIRGKDERGTDIWTIFDNGRAIPGDNSSPLRYVYRCDIEADNSQVNNMQFRRILDDDGNYWQPGYNQNQRTFVPTAGTGQLPYPLSFTMDLKKKATYSRMILTARNRNPPAYFSAPIPVEFDIWGTNNAKTVEEVECPLGIHPKGSREANQAYWGHNSWTFAGGTEAWKNDWVLLATCKLLLSTGDNKYYAGMVLSEEDLNNYLYNGWEFEFNLEVTTAFRYLRWVMHDVNTNQRELHIRRIQYFGSYAKE